jgi:hypothetical protein
LADGDAVGLADGAGVGFADGGADGFADGAGVGFSDTSAAVEVVSAVPPPVGGSGAVGAGVGASTTKPTASPAQAPSAQEISSVNSETIVPSGTTIEPEPSFSEAYATEPTPTNAAVTSRQAPASPL